MSLFTKVSLRIITPSKTQFIFIFSLLFIFLHGQSAFSSKLSTYTAPLAVGTLTFSSDAGAVWDDGIAEDGEGGSTDLTGIVIQTTMIKNAAGDNLGLPINWKNATQLSNTHNFSGLSTFDASINTTGWLGFQVKSADGAEFKIEGFRWYDWGGYTGEEVEVIGYRNGTQVASTSFNSNADNSIITVTLDSDFGDVDDVRIMFSSGSGWGSINDIQIGDPSPLPVTLISLKTELQEKKVNISWQTSQETNASEFEIQRSTDAKDFVKVGSMAAKGESADVTVYTFKDETAMDVLAPVAYYRLKMIDRDGTFAFSRIQNVTISKVNSLAIFPNPASDRFYLDPKELSETHSVSVTNIHGRIIYETSRIGSDGIAVNGFVPGMYVVKISKPNGISRSQKIVVR